MAIVSRTEYDRGIETVEQLPPDGWVVVDTFYPNPTNPPWDYQGGKHQREIGLVLQSAQIEYALLITREKIVHPVGTGPYGRVRMGDGDLPGVYRVAVRAEDERNALAAILEHQAAIREWLYNGGPCPTNLA